MEAAVEAPSKDAKGFKDDKVTRTPGTLSEALDVLAVLVVLEGVYCRDYRAASVRRSEMIFSNARIRSSRSTSLWRKVRARL
jgi:hypothetical protein